LLSIEWLSPEAQLPPSRPLYTLGVGLRIATLPRMASWRRLAIISTLVPLAVACAWHWLLARPYQRPLLPPVRPAFSANLAAAAAPAAASAVTPPRPAAASGLTPAPVIAARVSTPPFEYTDNYLLVGLDRRPFGGGAGLSDTIIVAVFDEPSDALGLVSIPRDLWVEIPGHAEDRINTVMNVARRSGEDPLALLGRVVENTLGLPIGHSVAIDIGVLERAIDALGGVSVDVPCPIVDRFLDPRDATGHRKLDLAAGTARLDGVTAAMYARSRHGRSDFSRARRQQAILVGMRRELSKPSSLVRLPTLFASFEDSIETDLSRGEALSLAGRLLRLSPAHLHGLVLGVEQVSAMQAAGGRAVLRPKRNAIDDALNQLFSAPSPGLPQVGSVCPKADVALSSG
jgi:polyisoprenyl-teichoic acid--peptidoglycan teichoic acid transferase